MSVASNSPLTSANVNGAFLSKSADSTGVAQYTLSRPSGSGSSVPDVQRRLNDAIWQTFATEEIAASGTIMSTTTDLRQYRRVKGLAGSQTASGTPFGTGGGWTDGTEIRLVGSDDSETLEIIHSDVQYGAILNGDIELIKYQSITLQYDSTLERWIEQSRN